MCVYFSTHPTEVCGKKVLKMLKLVMMRFTTRCREMTDTVVKKKNAKTHINTDQDDAWHKNLAHAAL